ncbi:MAG TPA: T9SS-dependent M36 family metallopeptidase [Flavobacterium sp.]|nr:T9SS-dependent M36 family metallopeptidase [Flavobacterium sp.]
MKKITQLLIFLLPVIGFSQAAKQKIQTYLNDNHVKMGLTTDDVTGWFVESTANSESTKIDNYYIKQRVGGIDVYNSILNMWVKNEEVLDFSGEFIQNASHKINAATPSLQVLDALSAAKSLLEVNNPGTFQIIETIDSHNFKISNGVLTEDPVTAELVYQPMEDNTLRLAWDFTFYTPGYNHMWSVRIDALDGKILSKYDMVISCDFGAVKKPDASFGRYIAFANNFYKSSNTAMNVTGGGYRVIPFNYVSLNYSPRVLINSPENAVASPFGWHDTNGVAGNEFTITRGNNVLAQDDANGNNGTGASPDGTASLTFDFPYVGTYTQPSTYLDAATTNLFYMNNIMHDVWFQYGFNEANKNFQQKNYTGFGSVLASDAVQADSQDNRDVAIATDGSNRNNANFSTPADGTKPRMQMYVWTFGPAIFPLTIIAPADFAGAREGRDNVFEPGHVNIPIAPASIESDLVLFDDGSADAGTTDNADACGPALNAAAINGHIAVIRRSLAEELGGTPCPFIEKVKNAQNAGATGVIIVNNVAPSDTVAAGINMSGADATVTIPAIAVTQAVGEALIARMKLETVRGKLQLGEPPFINADGDLDNGVIAHEYGHGISTRLTGTGSTCLQNAEQAGEGWSDWIALMMQIKPGDVGENGVAIGTFVASQAADGDGIRRVKYSTDMNINPITFIDSNDTESHNRGEVMATVLWDLTWAYINKYGYSADIYNGNAGNNKLMRLVIDAFKLQPCSPTFINFRTALIAADQATTSGSDYCTIWNVFARRGMGALASSGSATSATDQTEDFSLPGGTPNCALGLDYFNSDVIRVYPNPSNGEVTIHIAQFTGKVNIQVIDINGRIVYSVKENDFNVEKTINLDHLQSGMYVLKVNGEALNYTKKIILN